MKKLTVFFLSILSLLLSACAAVPLLPDSQDSLPTASAITETAYRAQVLKQRLSLAEAVSLFYYIGEIEIETPPQPTLNQAYWQNGRVITNMHGLTEGESLLLRVDHPDLKPGSRYLLFMNKNESVFYEKEFFTCGETVYQTGKDIFTDTITDIAGTDWGTLFAAVKKQVQNTTYREDSPVRDRYIHSTLPEEVLSKAPVVLRALVTETEQTADDRVLATLRVLERFSGAAAGTIKAVVPLDSVRAGTEYYFALSPADSLFVIAAPNSVYPVTEDYKKLLGR